MADQKKEKKKKTGLLTGAFLLHGNLPCFFMLQRTHIYIVRWMDFLRTPVDG